MAAILFVAFSSFAARAQSVTEFEADCITKHPTLSVEQCEAIAKRQMRAVSHPGGVNFAKPPAMPAATAATQPQTQNGERGAFVLFLPLLFLGAGVYLLPAIIGQNRHHHQRTAIWVLNVFLGWTVLGWVASLVWAASATPGAAKPS